MSFPRLHPLLPVLGLVASLLCGAHASAQDTRKPVLHGRHWVAITGKPLAATAGAMMFAARRQRHRRRLRHARCHLDDVGHPRLGRRDAGADLQPGHAKVMGINAMGVRPTGATPEFFRERGMVYPPEYGPLAAVTPGTPGGLMVMLAEYGRLSLAEVLAPSMQMAEGYPDRGGAGGQHGAAPRRASPQWPDSTRVFLPHLDEDNPSSAPRRAAARSSGSRAARHAAQARRSRSRSPRRGPVAREAIYAAYERFYRGDIAAEIVRASREHGGLFTTEDLADWEVHIEEPVTTAIAISMSTSSRPGYRARRCCRH
jgi:gamma-glutamyltranspeptidase/glutathione hydrolase